ncbi:type II secretion system F family protein [Prosthecodimorpha staleyi]|uniref:Type II secretion system F family protein n=1 Tax=Prosthecodimorpha staleyi TaxID=2840188 RepID=A0A947D589_9HYPH|nr:type II secretion system F family protein [Prosthecodimorpha staleyi]MBT9291283.1 type II secretion system F family protein [Prosthecodimorpha staleyi]
MFGPTFTILAIAVLAMLSAGGIAWALLYSRVQSENLTEKRVGALIDRERVSSEKRIQAEQSQRRRGIQDAIRDFEAKQQAKLKQNASPPLTLRLSQAGLKWTKKSFFIFSVLCGLGFVVLSLFIKAKLFIAAGAFIIGAFGFPRWFLAFRRKRRIKQFVDELPNAVDVIVRGIKSGLPLGDCLRIIANESREPVRSEFRQIVEAQHMGVPLGEACQKLFERMPVQEANFFGIVIMIQQKAGGNLSETLGNLSRVLRDRKKMRAKIAAVSMEAKASAGIIGSLPVIVSLLVYVTSPNYISVLFTTTAGNMIVASGLLYMFIGIMVMKKMINFDF